MLIMLVYAWFYMPNIHEVKWWLDAVAAEIYDVLKS
jgi:hypothetical protein